MKRDKVPFFCPDTAMGYVGLEEIRSDVQGSYTGRSEDPYEIPVQDADDL